jgi:hypothetical protein
MDRPPAFRYGIILALAAIAAMLPAMGCRNALFTAMCLIKGTDIDPDFAELKGKKVAVVCRSEATLQYGSANVARDLAKQVTLLLQERVPKVQTIDQRKVSKWTDENTWEEYSEVGKALKADMVVGIELENFSIFEGQTLYKGKANATIRVYDCQKRGKVVFEKILPQSVYPPNSAVATQDRLEPEFRREFVAVLADQIGRYFYAHDRHADLVLDAATLK